MNNPSVALASINTIVNGLQKYLPDTMLNNTHVSTHPTEFGEHLLELVREAQIKRHGNSSETTSYSYSSIVNLSDEDIACDCYCYHELTSNLNNHDVTTMLINLENALFSNKPKPRIEELL